MKSMILKKALACIILSSLLLSSLNGCGTRNIKDPDKTMDAFYQMMIYQDCNAMTDLGIDAKESKATVEEYQSAMISTFQKEFSAAGVAITKDQANDILDAIKDKFSQLDYKISILKEGKKEATVRVSSHYIDYLKIFKEAKIETINQLKPQHIEKLSDAKKQLVSNIITGFHNAEISSNMHSKIFHLKLQKIKTGKETVKVFFPTDYEKTGSDLIRLVTKQ